MVPFEFTSTDIPLMEANLSRIQVLFHVPQKLLDDEHYQGGMKKRPPSTNKSEL